MDQATVSKLNEIIDRGLCSGLGSAGSQVCIEAAIALACGEELGDSPACVHPVVRAHSIRLNDSPRWSSPAVRANSLQSYALQQLGCREIDGQEFARRLAFRTTREILPIALRAAKLESHAAACERAPDFTAAYASAAAAYADAASASASAAGSAASASASAAGSAAYSAAYAADASAAYASVSASAASIYAASAASVSASAASVSASAASIYAASAASVSASASDAILTLAARIATEILIELMAA